MTGLYYWNEKVLIQCIYAPNDDMTNSEKDNYSNTFFKTVFDDSMDLDYNIKITMGDFNVAPDHKMDTSEYLHINNPNSRQFLDKIIPLNMMTDIFRHTIFGCNQIIRNTILNYSEHTVDLNNPPELLDQALTSAALLISSSFLHDVILLEACSYSMRFAAKLKRDLLRKTGKLNNIIESKIDSDDPGEMEMVRHLKEEVQNIEDER